MNDIKTQEQKIDEIYNALVGSKLSGDGLILKHEKLCEKVKLLDSTVKDHSKYFSIIIGVGSIISLVVAFFSNMFGLLDNK